jgi:FAD/FMN-containing dehydrogenase
LRQIDADSLRSRLKGRAYTTADPEFNEIAFGGLWNELRPDRHPQLIVRVANDNDVIETINFARSNSVKVAVRGGGHNWCAPSLRNSGILIDLTNLNQVVSIDPKARKAVVQPIISNREMIKYLSKYHLAYPTGHCPEVKLSGYLLSGGMSWNQGEWGPGIGSVEAVEMVTANGELITASKDQHTDYFWAARGAGPGLFAVALRYHLKLYPLPKAITTSIYYYPMENLVEVADWLGSVAHRLPNNVELSFFLLNAPAEIVDKCKASNGKVSMLTATMFAETPDEAKAGLGVLEECPLLSKCIKKDVCQLATFEQLFDASGALWPAHLRNTVDAMFSNAPLPEIFGSVRDHFKASPSNLTVLLYAVFTGENVPAKLPDAAFSMTAKFYGGPWTMWEKAADDKANIAWHRKCVDLLEPHMMGHYVSESNTVQFPEYLEKAYSKSNLQRLTELRKKYDPTGVFFAYSDGLTANDP